MRAGHLPQSSASRFTAGPSGFPDRSSIRRQSDCGCIRCGGVWEAESNIKLLNLVSTPAAADWDTAFTVKRVGFVARRRGARMAGAAMGVEG